MYKTYNFFTVLWTKSSKLKIVFIVQNKFYLKCILDLFNCVLK